MTQPIRTLVAACLAFAALLPAPAMAEIYRWTDAQGRVHFGDKPKDGKQAEEVEVRDYRPGTDQEVLDVYQRTDRIYDAKDRQRQEEEAKKAAAQRATEEREQGRKDDCYAARERARKLEGPVIFVDDYGKPVKKTDAERRQALEETNKWIAANCP